MEEAQLKILLPIDGSPLSVNAVHHALRLVREGLRGSFVLANVQEPSSLYEMVVVHDPAALRRMSTEAGEHLLAEADRLLAQAGVDHELEVASGEPANTLIDLIENYRCDAVIMGARGMGESTATLGSVAHELLRRAPVPVMIVRGAPSADDADAAQAAAEELPESAGSDIAG
jgi:nucleotide-binding universal stress UspA family protein